MRIQESVTDRCTRPARSAGRWMSCLAILASLLVAVTCERTTGDEAAQAPGRAQAQPARRIKVLFLGDNGHHKPAERATQFLPVMAARGIDLTYRDNLDVLNSAYLSHFDCLLVYANTTEISHSQEQAILDFVASGKGFVPLHCASYCFLNSEAYLKLVGARFKSHATGTFQAQIIQPDHPAMQGVTEFESWDETYVHERHNPDRTVLMERVEDGKREPWTWVRTHGKGRVFYTASGHDEQTWSNPGFQTLVERGIRWACGDWALESYADPRIPFEYVSANVPNYVPKSRGGARGEAIRSMQLPLAPADSIQHFVTPPGFHVELFASEPDIVKPIAMNWDHRGRLWIAETVDYPNEMQAEGEGRDRIKICEDTDGDGRADKFTVFADQLSIPTSLQPYRTGVIVAQAPHMLFLDDTDGDDHADSRQVLYTGWGTQDTHAGPSNLRWGLDNWVWGSVGYSGFKGQVGAETHEFRQGIFRFRPDGSQLEFLGSTSNNTWGLGLSEEGLIFGSTANEQHSLYLPIPNRYYEAVRGWRGEQVVGIADHRGTHPITEHVRQVDWHGGFTAAAGHALYTARSFPREYWNRVAFVCEPTAHLVHQCLLEPDGAGFVARDGWNLLASDDEWSAPIAAEVGPDGAVWISDWYNFIVQHNPTPDGFDTGKGNAYETPLRDKGHGRIYRAVHDAASKLPNPDLAHATLEQLVRTLRDSRQFWRLAAQRRLIEQADRETLQALARLVDESQPDETGLNPAAIHGLWTLDGLGLLDGKNKVANDVALRGLKNSSAGVRMAAVQVMPSTRQSVEALSQAELLRDPSPQVVLASLLAISTRPRSGELAQQIVALLENPQQASDRWLVAAATSAAAHNDLEFVLAALAKDRRGKDSAALAATIRIVAEHYARGAPNSSVQKLLTSMVDAPSELAEAALSGLAAGWPSDQQPKVEGELEDSLGLLLERLPYSSQLALAGLTARWGASEKFADAMQRIRGALFEKARDADRSDEERLEAVRQIVNAGVDPSTLEQVLELITPQVSPELAIALLQSLGESSLDAVGQAIVDRWSTLTIEPRRAALAVLLRRAAWTASLLDGLDKGLLDPKDLSNDLVQRLTQHPDERLAEQARGIFSRGGRLPSAERKQVLEMFLPLADKSGDAALGKKVFEKNCAKCHRHGQLGEAIGPDLTGVALRKRSEILTDILDPNRSVEGNYRQFIVSTNDGLILSGLLKNETKTSLELLDNEAKKHFLLREDIAELIASSKSVMPEGFEKLPPEEISSLLEFLMARGKFVPVSIAQAATIVSTRGMFYSKDADVERLIFAEWGRQTAFGVPFDLIDPQGDRVNNTILLYGPLGDITREMPKTVSVDCHAPARAIHLLSGVSGWGFPYSAKGSESMIVRLHYADGESEDHVLKNGLHFADYIREVEVPDSKLAFKLRGQQLRYLAVYPKRNVSLEKIEFVKGSDNSAPIVMAVTLESPE